MAETVTMPKLGFDMAEGTLVRWVKAEGEAVMRGEILAEIETDKATVEVESPYSGVVNKYLVSQGDIVPVGTPIMVIAAPGERVEEAEGGQTEPMPQQPVSDTAGAEVKPKPEVQAQAQSDAQGQVDYQEGQGEEKGKVAADSASATQPQAQPLAPAGNGGPVSASPLARRVARENNLDLQTIRGSGPGGRIVRRDVEAALSQPQTAAPATAQPLPAAAPAAPKAGPVVGPVPAWIPSAQIPEDQVVEMDKLRTIIGKRMVEAKQQVPHFYVTREYNVEALLNLRKQLNEQLPEDQKLSVNDFIVKGVALTLRQFPNLNASIKGSQIVRHGHINVGNAVALESGLITVVSRDADQKPLRLLSSEVKDMVVRARSGKVRPDDIEGSTFSISNLGMYDVEHFVAIINPPEAAILAIGSAKQVPVVVNGELTVGTRMRATISADHRVTDGAEAARFMQALAEFIENPLRLVL